MRWAERAGWVMCGIAVAFAIAAFTSRAVGHDLAYYLASARELAAGRSPYVGPTPSCEAPVGCFPYPPPVLVIYLALLGLPFGPTAAAIATALTGVAVAVGAMLVAPLPRALRPWVAIAIALFFPLMLELNLLNMNLLTLALALGAWRMRDRPAIGGLLLAGAVGLKVLGAPLLLFYVAARRWRLLAWSAVAMALAAAATAPLVGHLWPEALGAIFWRATTEHVLGIRPGPLRGTVPYVAVGLVACAVIVASGLASRRSERHASDLHALALAAVPFLAHLIQYPALVMALPLLAALVRVLAVRPILLTLPAIAWLAMEMPVYMQGWRFGGLLALVAIGAALFLPRAFRRAPGAVG